jgi:hypothetical protein
MKGKNIRRKRENATKILSEGRLTRGFCFGDSGSDIRDEGGELSGEE